MMSSLFADPTQLRPTELASRVHSSILHSSGRDSRRSRRSRKAHEFTGVSQGRFRGVEPGHHARQLGGPILIGNLDDSAGRDLAVLSFDNYVMPIRESRDLRKMSHHDDLGVLGEPRQTATDLNRNLAAHTSIHLIEDQRDGLLISCQDDL